MVPSGSCARSLREKQGQHPCALFVVVVCVFTCELRYGKMGRKKCILFCDISAKRVEQRFCLFYHPSSNLYCNKSGCYRLRKVVPEGREQFYFCNKISTCCAFTDPRQTCFAASDVTPVYGVTPAKFIQSEVSIQRTFNKLICCKIDRFERGWKNAQRYFLSTALILQQYCSFYRRFTIHTIDIQVVATLIPPKKCLLPRTEQNCLLEKCLNVRMLDMSSEGLDKVGEFLTPDTRSFLLSRCSD